MKILSIISKASPSSGGPIQGIRNMHIGFSKYNVINEFVTFEDSIDLSNWNFPRNLKYYSLGKPITPLAYNSKLFDFIINNYMNYDYLLIHGIWQYHSICTVKALNFLKKKRPDIILPKVYCMPHGMLDPWFQTEKKRKFKAIRNFFYWHLFEKYVINSVDGLLFTCEQELLLAKSTFSGYLPKKEINVGYGIEVPPEKNLKFINAFTKCCPEIYGKKYLLFLSRIDIKKGVDLLIKSYNILSKENINLPHLVIAGSIDTNFAKKMIILANSNPKIHFTGLLTGDEKWGALYGCEVFILPSHQENFGIAIVESLACSKPVLITNKVNIFKEIYQAGAGFINEDTLDGTISNLKNWFDLNEMEKNKMSEDAHFAFLKYFKLDDFCLKFLNSI